MAAAAAEENSAALGAGRPRCSPIHGLGCSAAARRRSRRLCLPTTRPRGKGAAAGRDISKRARAQIELPRNVTRLTCVEWRRPQARRAMRGGRAAWEQIRGVLLRLCLWITCAQAHRFSLRQRPQPPQRRLHHPSLTADSAMRLHPACHRWVFLQVQHPVRRPRRFLTRTCDADALVLAHCLRAGTRRCFR